MVHTVFSERCDGDLAVSAAAGASDELVDRRARLAPGPWTWLRQVHGGTAHVVTVPGEHAGREGDAAVTSQQFAVLAVHVADCAPVLLWGEIPGGAAVVAAVHAGWKGLEAGVIGAAVAAMRRLGAGELAWTLGPCISPPAYEFSPADLERLAGHFGDAVRGRTAEGTPALDLRAAVAAALVAEGVTAAPEGGDPPCTAGSGRHFFSHRARGERQRQVGLIWWAPPAGAPSGAGS